MFLDERHAFLLVFFKETLITELFGLFADTAGPKLFGFLFSSRLTLLVHVFGDKKNKLSDTKILYF